MYFYSFSFNHCAGIIIALFKTRFSTDERCSLWVSCVRLSAKGLHFISTCMVACGTVLKYRYIYEMEESSIEMQINCTIAKLQKSHIYIFRYLHTSIEYISIISLLWQCLFLLVVIFLFAHHGINKTGRKHNTSTPSVSDLRYVIHLCLPFIYRYWYLQTSSDADRIYRNCNGNLEI